MRGKGYRNGVLLDGSVICKTWLVGALNPARLAALIRMWNWVPGIRSMRMPAVRLGRKY